MKKIILGAAVSLLCAACASTSNRQPNQVVGNIGDKAPFKAPTAMHEIKCELIKGNSLTPNSIEKLHEPITLMVSLASYQNVNLISGDRLGLLNILGISLNINGERTYFYGKTVSNFKLVLANENDVALFYTKPTKKRVFEGLIIATQIENSRYDAVEYNVRCKY